MIKFPSCFNEVSLHSAASNRCQFEKKFKTVYCNKIYNANANSRSIFSPMF
jgi:hypothetical protein